MPINKMMEAYGDKTTGGASCDGDFGNLLVKRWKDTKKTYCEAPLLKQKGTVGGQISSIDCYLVRQTMHHGNGDNLCLMKNVAVNMGFFGDEKKLDEAVRLYVGTKHAKQPYLTFPKGFVNAACETKPDLWKRDFMPGWNAEWTVGALQEIRSGDIICDEWIDHPVIIDQRDTFANFFHDSEDFVNIFLALAILEWNIGDVQTYLTDLYPEGPFWFVSIFVMVFNQFILLWMFYFVLILQGYLEEAFWSWA